MAETSTPSSSFKRSTMHSSITQGSEMDDASSMNLGKLEESIHTHSRSAKLALDKVAVGSLDSKREIEQIPRAVPSSIFIESNTCPLLPYEGTLMVLSEKKRLNSTDAKSAVFRFRLSFHRRDHHMRFVPGEHISLQCVSKKGTVLVRRYTPTSVTCRGEIELIIKIYSDGKFTRRLQRFEEGDNLVVRGPLQGNTTLVNLLDQFGCYCKCYLRIFCNVNRKFTRVNLPLLCLH
jgi:hypothetical protein